jgi:hypothetical protein
MHLAIAMDERLWEASGHEYIKTPEIHVRLA